MGEIKFSTPDIPKTDWYTVRLVLWTTFLSYVAIVNLLPTFQGKGLSFLTPLMDWLTVAAIVVVIWNFLDKRKKS